MPDAFCLINQLFLALHAMSRLLVDMDVTAIGKLFHHSCSQLDYPVQCVTRTIAMQLQRLQAQPQSPQVRALDMSFMTIVAVVNMLDSPVTFVV